MMGGCAGVGMDGGSVHVAILFRGEGFLMLDVEEGCVMPGR
jgi:hypothetical protein